MSVVGLYTHHVTDILVSPIFLAHDLGGHPALQVVAIRRTPAVELFHGRVPLLRTDD